MSLSLEERVDEAVRVLRALDRDRARAAGGWVRLREWVERRSRTDRVEYIDRADFPASKKLVTSRYLHLYNRVFRNYGAFIDILGPHLRSDRPVRVLELASGSGRFTLALARAARSAGVELAVTGSDVVPEVVAEASRLAERTDPSVRFRVLDAFDLGSVRERYDIVFTANALHHFTPGQLAKVIRGAGRVAPVFVGVDGRRSAWMLGLVSAGGLASGRWWVAHDAMVSARRFYGERELELIGRHAAEGEISVGHRGRHHSVLTVRFGPSRSAGGGR